MFDNCKLLFMKKNNLILRFCAFIFVLVCLTSCLLRKYEQVAFTDVRLVRIDTTYRYSSKSSEYKMLLVMTWMNKAENEWYTSYHSSLEGLYAVGMRMQLLRKR